MSHHKEQVCNNRDCPQFNPEKECPYLRPAVDTLLGEEKRIGVCCFDGSYRRVERIVFWNPLLALADATDRMVRSNAIAWLDDQIAKISWKLRGPKLQILVGFEHPLVLQARKFLTSMINHRG